MPLHSIKMHGYPLPDLSGPPVHSMDNQYPPPPVHHLHYQEHLSDAWHSCQAQADGELL